MSINFEAVLEQHIRTIELPAGRQVWITDAKAEGNDITVTWIEGTPAQILNILCGANLFEDAQET